jgi:hypothetical protein
MQSAPVLEPSRLKWARPVAVYLAAGIVFALLEGLIFRTGFYVNYVEPVSSTGIFEGVLREELQRKPLGRSEVLVIGDSRVAEGFSAPAANKARGDRGYFFANGAVPGSTPRCWYYQLRDLDPTRRRYTAIVLPIESYDDKDILENLSARTLDLHYVVARLRYSDIPEFTLSFHSATERVEVLRGTLLKGFVYQPDLLAFFENPGKRLKDARAWREHGWEWRNGYGGNEQDLAGLEVDWSARKVRMPDRLSLGKRQNLQSALLAPPPPQTGTMAAYRRQWFGRILDLYRGSTTRLVFAALPRGPAPRPGEAALGTEHSIRDFVSQNLATLLPEDAFRELERPELYFDHLHLNSRGRERFSAMLARLMRQELGPSDN